MTTKFYHPKGSMCSVCECRDVDCSKMNFKNMPQMKKYSKENDPNVFVIVKCTGFNKIKLEK